MLFRSEKIITDANKEADRLKAEASSYVLEQKNLVTKNAKKKSDLDDREAKLLLAQQELVSKQSELDKSIKDHRDLTALRSEEYEKALRTRKEFEDKLRQMREIANH